MGREIDYLRVSVTDRCNLRCRYCMPGGVPSVEHAEVLRYEELLRLCGLAAGLGIHAFKVTGGEPLVRRDCMSFLAELKKLRGVEQVTLTTNGILLPDHLEALRTAGVDGINVSLDTLDDGLYSSLTGAPPGTAALVWRAAEGIVELTAAADTVPADIRFIELMPIGAGKGRKGLPASEALERLRTRWPDLEPTGERRGNGPARYYGSTSLRARVGLISAVSRAFCSSCNRVRLTSTGELKPCLCYGGGTDLRALLRNGGTDRALREAMACCILQKPDAHGFGEGGAVTEARGMHEIGG